MLLEHLRYQLILELVVQELTTLVDQVRVLHHPLVHSCQQLVEMGQTKLINTQEEFLELELVAMLICTVAVEAVMEDIMEQEDIVSSVGVLPEVILEVETILETIKLVQHLAQVEQTDGLDPT